MRNETLVGPKQIALVASLLSGLLFWSVGARAQDVSRHDNEDAANQQTAKPSSAREGCDASYPGVCIPSPPPDLDCGDIPYRRFKVVGTDPHRFDRDKDGVGCESG